MSFTNWMTFSVAESRNQFHWYFWWYHNSFGFDTNSHTFNYKHLVEFWLKFFLFFTRFFNKLSPCDMFVHICSRWMRKEKIFVLKVTEIAQAHYEWVPHIFVLHGIQRHLSTNGWILDLSLINYNVMYDVIDFNCIIAFVNFFQLNDNYMVCYSKTDCIFEPIIVSSLLMYMIISIHFTATISCYAHTRGIVLMQAIVEFSTHFSVFMLLVCHT